MRCLACGRELKNASPTGMGPVCARQRGLVVPRHQLEEINPDQASLFPEEGEQMLDAEEAKLVQYGTVTITPAGITVEGFQGDGTSCRDVAALGMVWAIGELQRELQATMQAPGGGNVAVG